MAGPWVLLCKGNFQEGEHSVSLEGKGECGFRDETEEKQGE